eukprot:245236_1
MAENDTSNRSRREMLATVTGAYKFSKIAQKKKKSFADDIEENEKAFQESISNIADSETTNDQDIKDFQLKAEHKLSHQIAAYASFELMSSLMFGFSVSILFSTSYNEQFENGSAAEITFLLLMFCVLLSNLITMIVMSITSYFVNRYIADYKYVPAA